MALLNYSTYKKPEETLAEIQEILSRWGVSAIMTEYEGRQVSSISFKMIVSGQPMAFKLPCNWRSVHQVLMNHNANRKHKGTGYARRIERKIDDSEDQAISVAWRIIKDWIQAQMALVEVNMATVPQVFLPYAITADGRTLAEKIFDDPGSLLGSGK
jgi:hypothetical protein